MQMGSAPSVLGLILVCHYLILHELIYMPQDFFRGSLIPHLPFGIGRVAIQSTSRGNRIIRHAMDNKVENRWIKKHRLSNNCFTGSTVPFGQQKGKETLLLPIIVSLERNILLNEGFLLYR